MCNAGFYRYVEVWGGGLDGLRLWLSLLRMSPIMNDVTLSICMRYLATLCLLLLALSGCAGDAVVFAPTPAPPDLSPLPYTHPGGAFSLTVPRTWAVYEVNTTALASTAFSRPDETEPVLTVAVVNLGETPDDAAFGELMTRYQAQLRPDAERYTQQDNAPMGDGSWRMTGIRQLAGGSEQAVNTFIQRVGTRLVVIDLALPDDPAAQAELQRIVNTLMVNADAPLDPAGVDALAAAKPASLAIIHLFAWTTDDGVFFITGEVANYGAQDVYALPVRAVLQTAEGVGLAEAVDTVMGYAVPAGGFAPFSLRFGQGQPNGSMGYEVLLGSEIPAAADGELLPIDQLVTTDESFVDALGRLVVQGTAQNVGDTAARAPRAVVTVFDAAQNVIAAGYADLGVDEIAPGESAAYEIAIPDFGSDPVTTSTMVQGFTSR